MKRLIIHISFILIAILIYFLQSNFFSWFNIAGIMPNLFIILALFIGLFTNKTIGTIYSVIIGLFLDFLIGTNIGSYAISLGCIGFLSGIFDKNFSKDSRMTIIVIVTTATVIFEVLLYLLNYIFKSNQIEIVNFIRILVIEVIFNIILVIIIYPLMQKYGYYIENEYKGNKILTRYF